MQSLTTEEIRSAVRAALAEDIGEGDATTLATVPETATAAALLRAREPLVAAGLAFAEAAFQELSPCVRILREIEDAQPAAPGRTMLRIEGPARALLSAERVALNFAQRLSGVATLTAQFVAAVHDTRARILDTRKTTPGWRRFEKYAVTCGGGHNHRFGLFDRILIKDNHLAALRDASNTKLNGSRWKPSLSAIPTHAPSSWAVVATGFSRILAGVEPELLRTAAKPIVGFSDGTLLLAQAARAGLALIHGPVIAQLGRLAPEDHDGRFSRRWKSPDARSSCSGLEALVKGHAQGPLLGGNLEVFSRLLGTPWIRLTCGARSCSSRTWASAPTTRSPC